MGRVLCVEHEWLDEGPCPFCTGNEPMWPDCMAPDGAEPCVAYQKLVLHIKELERSLDQAAAEYVWDALEIDEDSPDYEQTKQEVLQRWLDIHKIPGEE